MYMISDYTHYIHNPLLQLAWRMVSGHRQQLDAYMPDHVLKTTEVYRFANNYCAHTFMIIAAGFE